jgi:thymidylate synthase
MIPIWERNAPRAFEEAMWKFKAYNPTPSTTRNGMAVTLPEPVLLEIARPDERVVACPERDANPFFHVMEWVWMLAGKKDVEWISKFNRNYVNYANDGIVHGAYGFRWRELWGDQIRRVIEQLLIDPNTRQAVISMWDPASDYLPHWRDRPCNTTIYFRHHDGMLDMTVCNRSNDLFWGMFGANIVHMTYLHELVASLSKLQLGTYRVFSNNLHYYTGIEGYPQFPEVPLKYDVYTECQPYPLVSPGETYPEFCMDAAMMISGYGIDPMLYSTRWFQNVAVHIMNAYLDKNNRWTHIMRIKAVDWRRACLEWANRRAVHEEDDDSGHKQVEADDVGE